MSRTTRLTLAIAAIAALMTGTIAFWASVKEEASFNRLLLAASCATTVLFVIAVDVSDRWQRKQVDAFIEQQRIIACLLPQGEWVVPASRWMTVHRSDFPLTYKVEYDASVGGVRVELTADALDRIERAREKGTPKREEFSP